MLHYMNITKQQLIKGGIALYILLTFVYMLYSFWGTFIIGYGQKAFTQGREATIAQLIQQAEDKNCQPFSVYTTEKTVQLINITCLKEAESGETSATEQK